MRPARNPKGKPFPDGEPERRLVPWWLHITAILLAGVAGVVLGVLLMGEPLSIFWQ